VKREQIIKDDFPSAGDGYDRTSVDAHLSAVAAWTAALEAQINALEVERDALRDRLQGAEEQTPPRAESARAAEPEPEPVEQESGSREPTTEPEEKAPPEPPVVQAPRSEAAPGGADFGGDVVSARLVATRLALEGSEHDEIVARISDAYELDDPESLVEDVLARLA
jgi:hypothetical protein